MTAATRFISSRVQLIRFYLNNTTNLHHAQYDGVAPQNGDRIATTDM